MRKLLLATAAFAVAGVGSALAASDTITVTTTLNQACSVDITNTNVSLPADASVTPAEGFSYQCNYGGVGSNATLTFASTNLGVGDASHPYFINPSTGTGGTSAASFNHVVGITTPNVANAATFTLQLEAPILIAGTYSDTLTVSIAP